MSKYPVAFNSDIVIRALGKGFEDFVEKYHGAKTQDRTKPPTDLQYEIAEYARKHSRKESAKKFKVPAVRVNQAINKVARHEWLNN